jgi:Endonuclease/Exonuclease/phosphatase family
MNYRPPETPGHPRLVNCTYSTLQTALLTEEAVLSWRPLEIARFVTRGAEILNPDNDTAESSPAFWAGPRGLGTVVVKPPVKSGVPGCRRHIRWRGGIWRTFSMRRTRRRTGVRTRCSGRSRTMLRGWTPQLRDRKVAQLASVIGQMNGGAGPDLLGVCEVENRFVLDLLVDALAQLLPVRTYRVVHADTADARGIDVAFLYDPALLEVPAGETFFHVVMRRTATREIVQVNFRTHTGRTWTVFRQPLALPQRRPVRVGRLPAHRRGNAGLLPPARPGSPRRDNTGAGEATSTTNPSTPHWSPTR